VSIISSSTLHEAAENIINTWLYRLKFYMHLSACLINNYLVPVLCRAEIVDFFKIAISWQSPQRYRHYCR